jgi:hypothetical protein
MSMEKEYMVRRIKRRADKSEEKKAGKYIWLVDFRERVNMDSESGKVFGDVADGTRS